LSSLGADANSRDISSKILEAADPKFFILLRLAGAYDFLASLREDRAFDLWQWGHSNGHARPIAYDGAIPVYDLDEWAAESRCDVQAVHAARFILAKWNPACDWACGRFDIRTAIECWDRSHRITFLEQVTKNVAVLT